MFLLIPNISLGFIFLCAIIWWIMSASEKKKDREAEIEAKKTES